MYTVSFVFSIYPIISKNDIFLNKEFLCDKNKNQYDFNTYIEFINIMIQSQSKKLYIYMINL